MTKRMQAIPILQVQHVSKVFSRGESALTVVNDITFAVAEKATLAVVGPSGSGKTTLLGICAGLDLPTTGSVVLAGQRLETLSEDDRARLRNATVGFVFQNFQLIPSLTALENVMVPMEIRGQTNVRRDAAELLAQVGLAERLGHYPVQLSGGEQQRVALARAFSNRPKILFADEPTGNLDTETGHSVVEILFEMNRVFDTTLVLITHDPELAERAQSSIRLRAGRMMEAGPKGSLAARQE